MHLESVLPAPMGEMADARRMAVAGAEFGHDIIRRDDTRGREEHLFLKCPGTGEYEEEKQQG
jgi:hypothetical protein